MGGTKGRTLERKSEGKERCLLSRSRKEKKTKLPFSAFCKAFLFLFLFYSLAVSASLVNSFCVEIHFVTEREYSLYCFLSDNNGEWGSLWILPACTY